MKAGICEIYFKIEDIWKYTFTSATTFTFTTWFPTKCHNLLLKFYEISLNVQLARLEHHSYRGKGKEMWYLIDHNNIANWSYLII